MLTTDVRTACPSLGALNCLVRTFFLSLLLLLCCSFGSHFLLIPLRQFGLTSGFVFLLHNKQCFCLLLSGEQQTNSEVTHPFLELLLLGSGPLLQSPISLSLPRLRPPWEQPLHNISLFHLLCVCVCVCVCACVRVCVCVCVCVCVRVRMLVSRYQLVYPLMHAHPAHSMNCYIIVCDL